MPGFLNARLMIALVCFCLENDWVGFAKTASENRLRLRKHPPAHGRCFLRKGQ